MIGISAQIGTNENAEVISFALNTHIDAYNNISAPANSIINKNLNKQNVFLLGVDKFSDMKTYSPNVVDYYISDIISEEDNIFPAQLSFSLTVDSSAKFIIMYFDTVNGEYPPVLFWDDVMYKLDSPSVCLPLNNETDHILTTREWNKPNRPFVVRGVQTFFNIEAEELISIDFSGQSRSDISKPSWGIISNTGQIDFLDYLGVVAQLSKHNFLSGSFINIYLQTPNKKEQIGGFFVDNAMRNEQNQKVQLFFSDVLKSWEEITVGEYFYPYTKNIISIKDVITEIVSKADVELELPYKTRQYLNTFFVPFPKIEAGSVWAQVSKICEATACYVYCNHKGTPIIKYSRGT